MMSDHVPHNGTETSKAAAESMATVAPALREQIYDIVRQCGATGVTCDEVEAAMNGRHQTISARFYDLHKAGRIEDSTLRRRTRSGRAAIVWILPKPRRDGWLFPEEER